MPEINTHPHLLSIPLPGWVAGLVLAICLLKISSSTLYNTDLGAGAAVDFDHLHSGFADNVVKHIRIPLLAANIEHDHVCRGVPRGRWIREDLVHDENAGAGVVPG